MKKVLITLAACTSFLSACGSPLASPPQPMRGIPQFAQQRATPPLARLSAEKATTAQTGFALALTEVNKLDPEAQLYEIDVWQEEDLGKSLHYGFLRSDNSGKSFRVIIDVASQQLKTEHGFKGAAKLVNRPYWKLDSAQIYARAQEYGLRDQFYLATLWEDTWHISGLKQHLYFQMDAQNGDIKLRCIGPYLNHCTLGDGSPVNGLRQSNPGMQAHLEARQARQSR